MQSLSSLGMTAQAIQAGTPWSILALLVGLALFVTMVGFRRTVYFISIGYTFAIVALAAAALIVLRHQWSIFPVLQSVLLALWGLRLGIFIIQRERGSSVYRQTLAQSEQKKPGFLANLVLWVGVSLLYVSMFSPALFSLYYGPATPPLRALPFQAVGLALLAGGLAIEALADKQKSDFKKAHPTAFCDTGLYGWVRFPNYLGEIMVWVGSWAMGLAFYANPVELGISLVGVVCLVLIMLGSARRLELSQDERYGSTSEYQEYVRRVPVLFPYLPVYSLKKLRIYLQ